MSLFYGKLYGSALRCVECCDNNRCFLSLLGNDVVLITMYCYVNECNTILMIRAIILLNFKV